MIFSEEIVSCIFLIVSSLSSVVPLSSLACPLHPLQVSDVSSDLPAVSLTLAATLSQSL